MNAIEVLAETSDTVTLRRSDFAMLLDAVETASDVALIDRVRAREKDVGKRAARRDYLTEQEMQLLLDGQNRLRLWREKRGVPQGALAQAIGISASYLADVETGIKPGSTDLYRRVAAFLELPLEVLLPLEPPAGASPMTLSADAAKALLQRAEQGAGPDEMAAAARHLVAVWLEEAAKQHAEHQVKAMIWRLRSNLTEFAEEKPPGARHGRQASRIKNRAQTESGQTAIEVAIDVLSREARRL